MRINRNNYEAYLLDLSEGNLSDELHSELNSFLASNPDLEVELIDEFASFEDESINTIDQDSLKFDEINISNRKHFFIAYYEGDLNISEQKKVEQFVSKNISLLKEFKQFSQLQLKSSEETYSDKKSLHSIAQDHKSKGLFYWSLRVAAILLIGFILNSLYQNSSEINPKYAIENGILGFEPSIPDVEKIDFNTFNKDNREINKTNTLTEYASVKTTSSNNKPSKTKTDGSNSEKDPSINTPESKELRIPKRNPELDEVITSLNPRMENQENDIPLTLPAKRIQTPPSLLAYLGQKAKEKEILSENGLPNIVSLINKGSKSLTGRDILALSQTEEATSKVFQLGSFKIERISKK